jgi:hypothetical protein
MPIRFSIKHLAVGLLVASFSLAWFSSKWHQQQLEDSAASNLAGNGCHISFASDLKRSSWLNFVVRINDPVVAIHTDGMSIDDLDIGTFSRLEEIDTFNTEWSGPKIDTVQQLAKLKSLRKLCFATSTLSDVSPLAHLCPRIP